MSENVHRLSRRQFLIRLGAASAVITVAGAEISNLLNTGTISAPTTGGVASNPNGTAEAVGEVPTTFPNANDPVKARSRHARRADADCRFLPHRHRRHSAVD